MRYSVICWHRSVFRAKIIRKRTISGGETLLKQRIRTRLPNFFKTVILTSILNRCLCLWAHLICQTMQLQDSVIGMFYWCNWDMYRLIFIHRALRDSQRTMRHRQASIQVKPTIPTILLTRRTRLSFHIKPPDFLRPKKTYFPYGQTYLSHSGEFHTFSLLVPLVKLYSVRTSGIPTSHILGVLHTRINLWLYPLARDSGQCIVNCRCTFCGCACRERVGLYVKRSNCVVLSPSTNEVSAS